MGTTNPLRRAMLVPIITVALSSFYTTSAQDRSLRSETATFAGGCFWCMEPPFDELNGVLSTTSGYTGGDERNPTYEEVSSGTTGHAEALQVVYNPSVISYSKLLDVFWKNVDPTASDRQFCDRGHQYRSEIFFHNEAQRILAEESQRRIEQQPELKGKVVTRISELKVFYPAEEYHQDFYRKNPIRYKSYRLGCGRDQRLKELWGEGAGH